MSRLSALTCAIVVLLFSSAYSQVPYDCPGCNSNEVGSFQASGTSSGSGCPCPDTPSGWSDCSFAARIYVAEVTSTYDPDSEPFVLNGVLQFHYETWKKIEFRCVCVEGNHNCVTIEEEVVITECSVCPEFEEPEG